ncbi:TadE family protein [uncultured Friedmanniella sp.]|uniref:TadE family protein n=1 Tax=uncultured Friedmanniella sp. TaxID=335381 RepID=UPI0035C99E7D
MRTVKRRHGSERGSATIEAVIIVPALMVFAALVLAAGRVTIAHQSVELAAAEAARSASLARSPAEAQAQGAAAASAALDDRRLDCRSRSVLVDAANLSAPLGTAGQVTTRVVCVVDLSDVAVPGLPGTVTIDARAASPVDQYRERGR